MSEDKKDKENPPNIRIGGNVSGGNVNIGGNQTIHGNLTINSGGSDAKQELQTLLNQLVDELKKVPADDSSTAKKVELAAEDVAAEASKPQPDKSRLQIRGEALVEAAKNLLTVAPIAVEIAKKLLMIG